MSPSSPILTELSGSLSCLVHYLVMETSRDADLFLWAQQASTSKDPGGPAHLEREVANPSDGRTCEEGI